MWICNVGLYKKTGRSRTTYDTKCEAIVDASDKLKTIMSKVEDIYERVDREVSTHSTNNAITVATAQETLPTSVSNLSMDGVSDGNWTTIARRGIVKNNSPTKVRVRRTKATGETNVPKVIPRQPILAAFVGRLHRDTKEEDRHKYLTEIGMKGVVCRRLKPKAGHTCCILCQLLCRVF